MAPSRADAGSILFGAMCVLSIVFVALVVPETRGVPLEQMDALFKGSIDERTPLLTADVSTARLRRFSHSHAV